MAGIFDQIRPAGAPPTMAQGILSFFRNIPGALSAAASGNAYGTAEPNNAVSDLERQRFWRGSVMGQDAGAQARNMERALNVALAAPTVYHGSPHKFDKFDSSKIGTGEGAQAYGHGIYFAENPKVAQDYAVNLSAKNGEVGGRIGNTPIADAYKAIESQANRLPPAQAAPLYNRLDLLERLGFNELPDDVLQYAKESYGATSPEVSWLQTSVLNKYKGPGNMYKVDLPDAMAAKMLDWDKALKDQHPDIQSALEKIGITQPPSASQDLIEAAKAKFNLTKSREDLNAFHKLVNEDRNIFGADIYRKLAAQPHLLPGFKVGMDSNAVAAQYLRDAGIPGIRYLDGGSRGAGQGTSNYVAFPGTEGMLKILGRE